MHFLILKYVIGDNHLWRNPSARKNTCMAQRYDVLQRSGLRCLSGATNCNRLPICNLRNPKICMASSPSGIFWCQVQDRCHLLMGLLVLLPLRLLVFLALGWHLLLAPGLAADKHSGTWVPSPSPAPRQKPLSAPPGQRPLPLVLHFACDVSFCSASPQASWIPILALVLSFPHSAAMRTASNNKI